MLTALAELAVPMAWLTSWTHKAPDAFVGLMPPDMKVLTRGTEETGWWKLDTLARYLDAHPRITRVVWADDQLSESDPDLGVSFAQIAADLLDDRCIAHLLLACPAELGLTRRDLAAIADFLAGQTDSSAAGAAPKTRAPAGRAPDFAAEPDPFAGPFPVHTTPLRTTPRSPRRQGTAAGGGDDPFAGLPAPGAGADGGSQHRTAVATGTGKGQDHDDPFA